MNKLWCSIKEWRNEVVGILLAVALFLLSPVALRLVDPTAGAYDAGVLQVIVFAIVGTLTFSFLSWIGLKINFKNLWTYSQSDEVLEDFRNLTGWQKIKILFGVYFGYLLVFTLICRVL